MKDIAYKLESIEQYNKIYDILSRKGENIIDERNYVRRNFKDSIYLYYNNRKRRYVVYPMHLLVFLSPSDYIFRNINTLFKKDISYNYRLKIKIIKL